MQEEKQGAERELEEKAIQAQHEAQMEHLRKNVHPSLHSSISLGDSSKGTCQGISDYAALTLKEQVAALQAQVNELRAKLEEFRLKIFPEATPETQIEGSELLDRSEEL